MIKFLFWFFEPFGSFTHDKMGAFEAFLALIYAGLCFLVITKMERWKDIVIFFLSMVILARFILVAIY